MFPGDKIERPELMAFAISDTRGQVKLRLCRPKTTLEKDCSPLPLVNGVLDHELTVEEMRDFHQKLTNALWHRIFE